MLVNLIIILWLEYKYSVYIFDMLGEGVIIFGLEVVVRIGNVCFGGVGFVRVIGLFVFWWDLWNNN